MNAMLRRNIADWHGAQAADAYAKYMRLSLNPSHIKNAEEELRMYERHIQIAGKMWKETHG